MDMLSARLYGKDDLRVELMPIPEIGRGEILLRVKAAAVCGTDLRMLKNGVSGVDETHPLVHSQCCNLGPKFISFDIVSNFGRRISWENAIVLRLQVMKLFSLKAS
jgi:hypothetical protein